MNTDIYLNHDVFHNQLSQFKFYQGRDIKYLCQSYLFNLVLTFATLTIGFMKGWGLPGIWLALGQFMFVRLLMLFGRLARKDSILFKPPAFALMDRQFRTT